MEKLKVTIQNQQKQVKIPSGIRLLVRRACHAALVHEGYKSSYEVDVLFVDNNAIRQLNREHRHKDAATDVLSFPLGEDSVYDKNPETGFYMLGDIVISVEQANIQAKSYGHSFQREMAFLVVHSMLHLLGYDHENGGLQALRMEEKEEKVLASLGLSRAASIVIQNGE